MGIQYHGEDRQLAEMVAYLNGHDPAVGRITLTAEEDAGAPLTVRRDGEAAVIRYGRRVELFRGLGLLFEHRAEERFETTQPRVFTMDGVMADCSRNAVLQEAAVERMIRTMALMGLDTLMLYTENTYEIPEYAYFGYMRGRYTQEELRRLNAYAAGYGVELIPCIQTLAHLEGALRWQRFETIRDTEDILLLDDAHTYALIEAMIRSCRASYTTDRIHIGMDEALLMGLGQYRLKNGDGNRAELFCRHLKRVTEICQAYGFRPMMWSDMFFRLVSGEYYEGDLSSDEVLRRIPAQLDLVYWDYYQTDRQVYARSMERHGVFDNPVIFAGGAWRWANYAPSIGYSLRVSRMALDACLDKGIRQVFVTAWGDDGSDSSMFSILPVMQLYAEYGYGMPTDDEALRSRLMACTGERLEDMLLMDLPDLPAGEVTGPSSNPCKYLLFQDPLCSLFDRHIGPEYPARYREFAERLRTAAATGTNLCYAYAALAALCEVLWRKCRYHQEVSAAYAAGDRDAVRRIAAQQLPELCDRLREFTGCLETQWMTENKSWGFEVQDLRLGGLQARLETAARRLTAWADGAVGAIEELEEPRLTFDGRSSEPGEPVYCYLWRQMATASRL